MRIAIMSDSHDHINNTRQAVAYCKSYNVELILHCGDLVSPFMLKEFAEFNGPVHLVYGNNPGDKHLISQFCGTRFPNLTHHGDLGVLEAAGLKIAFTHYPQFAWGLFKEGNFDIICCGHTHHYSVEQSGSRWLINPGELLGMEGHPCFAIFDSANSIVERVDLMDGGSPKG